MKKLLSIIFIVASLNGFAKQWAEYKVDSNLTITIPDNFVTIDTMEQHIVKVQISNALIMIQRIANTGKLATNILSKDELIKNYEGFQKGAVDSQHGKLISQQMLEKNGLQMTQFSFAATMGEEKQLRHFVVVFFNENWYSISFWEVEALTNELKDDRDKLFSSIVFPKGSSLENQLSKTVEGSSAYKSGYLVGKMLGYTMIIGAVVALIAWISNTRKKKRNKVSV